MSMLFVIYMPVMEPEPFADDADNGVLPGRSRAVSVTMLYSRYVDHMRLTRGGTENPVPAHQPDQPAPPPVLPKSKTPAKPVVETLSGLVEALAKRPSTSDSVEAASEAQDSSVIPPMSETVISPMSETDIMQNQETSNSVHFFSENENLNADDVALIPKDKQKPDDDSDRHRQLSISDDAGKEEHKHLTLRQVTFVADSETCDLVLNSLVTFGFGKITGTSMSLFSSSYYSGGGQSVSGQNSEAGFKKDAEEKSEFAKSVKARLTVAQVLGAVKTNSSITFDFLIMITAASFIAALGLAENSAVSIVASMLISPMMGPTIGITFGICIKSAELWKLAVKSECICLCFCMVFGYVFGLITAVVNLNGAYWGGSDSWPTTEMASRGMVRSLWVGVLTATLSGLGVALSILGGNVGSLVGVAISASILPPAVNAGVLWAHATVWAIHAPAYDYKRLAAGTTLQKIYPSCPFLLKNEYQFTYSCQAHLETLLLGTCSILLTIVNIFCIFLIAIAVLKVKEVAPNVNIFTTKTPTDVFWRKDVPMVRKTRRKSRGADLPRLAAEFAEEYKSLKTDAEKKKLVQKWQRIIGSLEDDPVYSQTTQHLTNTMPEIFRLISQRDTGTLPVSTLHNYDRPPAEQPTETQGMVGTIQGFASDIGHRLWSWIPTTGTTETKPESAEPVPGNRRTSKKSLSWATATYPTTEGSHDSHARNDRSVFSPVQEHP